jgi:hypothetical protein
MPDLNIFDKFLKSIGKKRGVRYPVEAYAKYGQSVYIKATKENFWKAFFRSKHQDLPEGYIDLYSFYDLRNNHQSGSQKQVIYFQHYLEVWIDAAYFPI